jgi:transglutaminase-like putative cysteine protease
MDFKIIHKTVYTYHEPISLCHNIARLIPRSTEKQTCKNILIAIDPEPVIINEYEDFFGNRVLYFSVQQEHQELTVMVTSEINKSDSDILTIDSYPHAAWEVVKKQLNVPGPENADARQYVHETPLTSASPEISTYAIHSFTTGRSVFDASRDLMERIHKDFEFQPGFTTVAIPATEVIKQRKGVCQDFSHVAIACLRSIGLAARYVSGYIETLPPIGIEKLAGVDASHAWFAVFIPGTGWIDFDPTNNQISSAQHISIGWGRDYADITPLKGVIESGGPHVLSVSVDVRRMG